MNSNPLVPWHIIVDTLFEESHPVTVIFRNPFIMSRLVSKCSPGRKLTVRLSWSRKPLFEANSARVKQVPVR